MHTYAESVRGWLFILLASNTNNLHLNSRPTEHARGQHCVRQTDAHRHITCPVFLVHCPCWRRHVYSMACTSSSSHQQKTSVTDSNKDRFRIWNMIVRMFLHRNNVLRMLCAVSCVAHAFAFECELTSWMCECKTWNNEAIGRSPQQSSQAQVRKCVCTSIIHDVQIVILRHTTRRYQYWFWMFYSVFPENMNRQNIGWLVYNNERVNRLASLRRSNIIVINISS